jgi:hypothetical protein
MGPMAEKAALPLFLRPFLAAQKLLSAGANGFFF